MFKVPNTSTRLFTRLKDSIPFTEQSNLVYKINCLGCNLCYIGQTKQHLRKRVYNHSYSVKSKDLFKSDLSEHALTLGHKFDYDNPEIVATESNLHHRLIEEMLNIARNLTCNKRSDIDRLSNLYTPLLL